MTAARRLIDELETGERLSFTAFLVHCLVRAVDEHPEVAAYRDWRGRLVTFEHVDVMVIVETTVGGERLGLPHVVRSAEERSVRSIRGEIRAAQRTPGSLQRSPWLPLFLRLPGAIRRLFYRLPRWSPRRWKRVAGTVSVSSVGMFGTGGGWGITPTNYPLQLTVGGIARKPGVAGKGTRSSPGSTSTSRRRATTTWPTVRPPCGSSNGSGNSWREDTGSERAGTGTRSERSHGERRAGGTRGYHFVMPAFPCE